MTVLYKNETFLSSESLSVRALITLTVICLATKGQQVPNHWKGSSPTLGWLGSLHHMPGQE